MLTELQSCAGCAYGVQECGLLCVLAPLAGIALFSDHSPYFLQGEEIHIYSSLLEPEHPGECSTPPLSSFKASALSASEWMPLLSPSHTPQGSLSGASPVCFCSAHRKEINSWSRCTHIYCLTKLRTFSPGLSSTVSPDLLISLMKFGVCVWLHLVQSNAKLPSFLKVFESH